MDQNSAKGDYATAVVGGGVSGLAFAYGMSQYNMKTIIFDTGKNTIGGRCSSKVLKTKNGKAVVVDHACQLFSISNDKNIQQIFQEMEVDGAVTKIGNIVKCNSKDNEFKSVQCSSLYAGNSEHGINSICQWFVKKCVKNLTIHQDVWISKLKQNVDQQLPLWMLSGKQIKKPFGPYSYAVVAHNGKCADRLIRTSNVKTQAHSILKCKFVASGSNNTVKYLELKSLFVVIVEINYDNDSMFTGCFIDNNNTLSWICNNTRKYNRVQSSTQVWTLISTAKYASKNKCPQENIPEKVKRKVARDMCQSFFSILQGYLRKDVVATKDGDNENYNNNVHKQVEKIELLRKDRHVMHVQLWGAALPCNTMNHGHFLNDNKNQIGVIGDWFVKPSIEGSILSGLALADALASDRSGVKGQEKSTFLKDRSLVSSVNNNDTTFSLYTAREIGSFDGVLKPYDICDQYEAKILTKSNMKKKKKKRRKKKGKDSAEDGGGKQQEEKNEDLLNKNGGDSTIQVDDGSTNSKKVNANIGNNHKGVVGRGKQRGGKRKNQKTESEKSNYTSTNKKKMKNGKQMKNKLRPNYFLSVRIKNEVLKQRAQSVIDVSVILGGDDVKKCVVPTRDLHLTLFVFHLKSQEDILKANKLLASTHDQLNQIIGNKGLALTFCNVSSFKKDVIFIDVVQDEAYEKFYQVANFLYKAFYKAGFIITNQLDADNILIADSEIPPLKLKPHATLLKTSKAKFKKGERRRKIALKIPDLFANRYFGVSHMDRVELSAMQLKDSEGYYACKGYVSINENVVDNGDVNIEHILQSLERITISQNAMLNQIEKSIGHVNKNLCEALTSNVS